MTMNNMKHTKSVAKCTSLLVLVALLATTLAVPAGAQSAAPQSSRASKIAPDLRELVRSGSATNDRVSVILQFTGSEDGPLNSLLNRNGVHVKNRFQSFNSLAVELPAEVVDELASYPEVTYISTDSKVEAHGHLTATTGADLIRTQVTTNTYISATDNSGSDSVLGTMTTCTPGNNLVATTSYNCTTTTTTSIDGKGFGIAILDSGVDVNHISLNEGSNARVVFSQDFTGE